MIDETNGRRLFLVFLNVYIHKTELSLDKLDCIALERDDEDILEFPFTTMENGRQAGPWT